MRFYGYVHFQLSSIQQGIQAKHALGEMVVEAADHPETSPAMMAWLRGHRTTILLNGGNSKGLHELKAAWASVQKLQPTLPYSLFHESEEAMEGILTAVGVVLDEDIYAQPDVRVENFLMTDRLALPSAYDPLGDMPNLGRMSATDRISLLRDMNAPWDIQACALLLGYKLAQ